MFVSKSKGDSGAAVVVFDIFASADRRSAAITYLGSLEAPSEELGRIYAQRMFARRNEHRSLWLVRRSSELNEAVERISVAGHRSKTGASSRQDK